MSDVKFCIKDLNFNIPIIYRTTAKYQTVVFSRRLFTLFLKFRSLNVNSSAIVFTEFCIHISRLTWFALFSE